MNEAEEVRNENYIIALDKFHSQEELIKEVISILQKTGASGIYFYLNVYFKGEEDKEYIPITSIRRTLTNLKKKQKVLYCEKIQSLKYPSTEMSYRVNPEAN